MNITRIHLKNFRCLAPYQIAIEAPIVLITGPNGVGKTTVLEALYYACYLRSFRTYLPRELITFKQTSFVINLSFEAYVDEQRVHHNLHVGFHQQKKLVRNDGKISQTYKDLLDYYRVISVTTDDMQLISGSPQKRRTFIDQALSLLDTSYVYELRTYRTILHNRNALLHSKSIDNSLYHLWSKQLWQKTRYIQERRIKLLADLQNKTTDLLSSFFDQAVQIEMVYKSCILKNEASYEEFSAVHQDLPLKERAMHRSLFGVHLDDIFVGFDTKKSKLYASRGQQKLTVFLMKAALVQYIVQHKGKVILLLDDFMGDFDQNMLARLYDLLKYMNCQLIFTSPASQGYLEQKLLNGGGQEVRLTHSKL